VTPVFILLHPNDSLPFFQPFADAQLFQVELLPEQKKLCGRVRLIKKDQK